LSENDLKEAQAHDPIADGVQYLHDDRLVWAPQVQGLAFVDCDFGELGGLRLSSIAFKSRRIESATTSSTPPN
jgi:hypothetical protein